MNAIDHGWSGTHWLTNQPLTFPQTVTILVTHFPVQSLVIYEIHLFILQNARLRVKYGTVSSQQNEVNGIKYYQADVERVI